MLSTACYVWSLQYHQYYSNTIKYKVYNKFIFYTSCNMVLWH